MAYRGRYSALTLLFVSIAVIVPSHRAHIGEFDEYWQKRAEEAKKAILNAYHPFPAEVTNHINHHVHMALKGSNDTRRSLRRHADGPCIATNPIDRCWRCDPNWEQNRKKLAECVLGFGRNTRGGVLGDYYVVTDPSDDSLTNPRPGTLRHAVTRNGPLWIIFAHDMNIRLSQELLVTSDKTIDGRGANVLIFGGAGLMLQFVNNVIVHGIRIHNIYPGEGGLIMDSEDHIGIRTRSDGDAVSIFGSSNIWVDHVSMSRASDGLVDAIEGSTGITVSNCHMTDHNEVMLFGASDKYIGDEKMQITLAFNHFGKGLIQRMPRCRLGFFHVVNNDYTHWLMYAIGGSEHPTIISQGNRFIAPPVIDPKNNATEVTKREYAPEFVWQNWLWKSENDMMMNGAFFVPSGDPNAQLPYSSADMITAKPATFVTRLTRYAGALNCKIGLPC